MAILATIDIDPSLLKTKLNDFIIDKYVRPSIKLFLIEHEDDLKDIIMEKIVSTESWQSIAGDYAGKGNGDLEAVFGLADSDSVLSGLEDLIRKLIDIKVGNDGTSLTVGLHHTIETKLAASGLGSYISHPSGELIPWLKWALTGQGSIDGFEINFNPKSNQRKRSRSGRAVMQEGDGWQMSDSEAYFGSTNFLIEAYSDGEIVQQISELFQAKIAKLFNVKRKK